MEVSVLSYGGTIASVRVPCRHGHLKDVVLGRDDVPGEYVAAC